MATLLTTEEAATRHGVSRWTVARACRSGRLAGATRNGAHGWRVPVDELDALFAPDELSGLRLYTLTQVHAATQIPLRWLEEGCRSGKLRAVKVSRHWQMDAEMVQAARVQADKDTRAAIGTTTDPDLQRERSRQVRPARKRSTATA